MLKIGDSVRITNSIWDDGEDHHPPSWLAHCNEILVVRAVGNNGKLAVSHSDIVDRSFWINSGEYEKVHQ